MLRETESTDSCGYAPGQYTSFRGRRLNHFNTRNVSCLPAQERGSFFGRGMIGWTRIATSSPRCVQPTATK